MPQGWKMELAGIDGAAGQVGQGGRDRRSWPRSWATTRSGSTTTSTTCPRPAHEAVFECWTTHGRHQPAHQPDPPRPDGRAATRTGNPALLAKITSTVDVISGGRLDWGIGAGWYENEYKGYGYEFPPPTDRIGMLRETVEIVKLDVDRARRRPTRASTTSSRRANCDPKPVQQPAPADLDRRRRRAAHAAGRRPATPTARNFGGKPDEFAPQVRGAEGALRRGRAATTTRSARRGHPRCSSARPRPRSSAAGSRSVLGRAVRVVARRATSSARPSRCARRSRPTSTSAAPASSRGAPTTRTPRRLDAAGRREVMPEFR